MADTFISYSRHNTVEKDYLVEYLLSKSLAPWVDDQIPAGEKWSDEIAGAIEDSGSLVVIVTPQALSSMEVAREVEHAMHNGKPIIPLILSLPENAINNSSSQIPKEINFNQLPPWIEQHQIVDGRGKNLQQVFNKIEESVRKDHYWRTLHAKLLGRARNWNSGKGSLLSGHDLDEAYFLLEKEKIIKANDLLRNFIRTSKKDQKQRRSEKANRLAEVILAGFYDPDLSIPLALENVKVNTSSVRAILALDWAIRQSSGRLISPRQDSDDVHVLHFLDNRDLIIGFNNEKDGGRSHFAITISLEDDKPATRYNSSPLGLIRAINTKGQMIIEDGSIIKLADTLKNRHEHLKFYLPFGLAAAAFNATGNLLVTTDHRGHTWLWDMKLHKPILELVPSQESTSKLFGKSASRKPKILENGKLQGKAPQADGSITAAISSNGLYAAVGYDSEGDNCIAVYDTSDGKQVLNLELEWAITTLNFRPKHHDLLYVSDGEAFLQPVPSGVSIRLTGGLSNMHGALIGSPDGQLAAAVCRDGFVRVIDLERRDEVKILGGHDFGRYVAPCFFKERQLITGLVNSTLRLWDLDNDGSQLRLDIRDCPSSGIIVARDPGVRTLEHVSISPDGKMLCAVAWPLHACVWNLLDISKRSGIYPIPAHGVNLLAWLDGESFVAIPYEDLTVLQQSIYQYYLGEDEEHGCKLLLSCDTDSLDDETNPDPYQAYDLKREQGYYTGLWISADKKRLAVQVSGSNDIVEVWQINPLKCLLKQPGKVLALNEDGHCLLLSDGEDGYALWSVEKHSRIELPDFDVRKHHLATWSPHGGQFALAHNFMVTIIDAEGKKDPVEITGHRARISSMAFSPDGKNLASGAEDGSLRLWDVYSGEELRRFDLSPNGVTTVCFTPDGSSVVSGHTDSFIRFWRLWSLNDLKNIAKEKSYGLSDADKRRFDLGDK